MRERHVHAVQTRRAAGLACRLFKWAVLSRAKLSPRPLLSKSVVGAEWGESPIASDASRFNASHPPAFSKIGGAILSRGKSGEGGGICSA